MIVVTTAHLSKSDANMLGEINISKINDTIALNGIEYKYLASGLCREVYYSKDTQYIIKIPKQKESLCDFNSFDYSDNTFSTVSIDHNIAEAQMYDDCPEHLKEKLPETILLANGWIKQAYVDVIKVTNQTKYSNIISFGIREYGKHKGKGTFFDFCFMMRDFKKPEYGWDWDKLEKYLKIVE